MKKKFATLLLLTSMVAVFSACTKVTDHPNSLTKTQILVKNTWQVEEVWRNISGLNSHFLRNGENTTGTDYQNIRLIFQADGTGTYTDEVGIVHDVRWDFLTSDQRNVRYEISSPSANVFTWHLVEISDSSLSNTTPLGNDILVSARYTPIAQNK